MNQFEQQVRELAYLIWESEGQPSGHEYRHWEMALKLAEMQRDGAEESDAVLGDPKIEKKKPGKPE